MVGRHWQQDECVAGPEFSTDLICQRNTMLYDDSFVSVIWWQCDGRTNAITEQRQNGWNTGLAPQFPGCLSYLNMWKYALLLLNLLNTGKEHQQLNGEASLRFDNCLKCKDLLLNNILPCQRNAYYEVIWGLKYTDLSIGKCVRTLGQEKIALQV